MGKLRFYAPSEPITKYLLQETYMSGWERIPWKCEVSYDDGVLLIQRHRSEAGIVHLPWPDHRHGLIMLSTGTLRERKRPYHLLLELARGKIGQVLRQMFEWQMLGLVLTRRLRRQLEKTLKMLSNAVACLEREEELTPLCEEIIAEAIVCQVYLTDLFIEQSLTARRRLDRRFPVRLGFTHGSAVPEPSIVPFLKSTFHEMNLGLLWKDIEPEEGHFRWEEADRRIEWASTHGLRCSIGPLFPFEDQKLPAWVVEDLDQWDLLLERVERFILRLSERYQETFDFWIATSRGNSLTLGNMEKHHQLSLTAQIVEMLQQHVNPVASDDTQTTVTEGVLDNNATRQLDRKHARVLVSIDQPWGEYLLHSHDTLTPFGIGETFTSLAGVDGIILEINFAHHPRGTLPRDPLEFAKLLDFWGMLEKPIYLVITVPSASGQDLQASLEQTKVTGRWTKTIQQEWVHRYCQIALSKRCVHGINWSQLRDDQPHEFPNAGLIDQEGTPKPALLKLRALRNAYLE